MGVARLFYLLALTSLALYVLCRSIGKGKASPCLIAERRVQELIAVLGSQPAGDVSHKPSGRPCVCVRARVCVCVRA